MRFTRLLAAVAVASMALGSASAAQAAPALRSQQTAQLTLLSTTDTHGNVFSWD